MKSSYYSRPQTFSFYNPVKAFFIAIFAVLPLLQAALPARCDNFPVQSAAPGTVAAPPTHGSGVNIGHKVVLVARPLDSNRVVTSVRFLLDGGTLAECGAPGRWVWDTSGIREGRHVVQVQAFDHELFIGLSEPLVVYTGQAIAANHYSPTLDVPFFTYEMDPRRSAAIVAPRIAIVQGASIGEAGEASSPRLATALVEVYLNGIKQDFAPAARVATADELGGRAPGATAVSQNKPRVAARTRAARRAQAAREKREQAERMARIARETRRTVWLPARPLLERLGAQVSWQPKSGVLVADLRIAGAPRRIVLSPKGGNAVQTEIGGQRIALSTPVRLAENTIMVPLSFCKDALDLRVRWQKDFRKVEMFTPISPA